MKAKGEEVGPEEPDPTAPKEVGLLGLLKFIVYCLLIVVLASKFFTGSFLFDYESKLPSLRKLWPVCIDNLSLQKTKLIWGTMTDERTLVLGGRASQVRR